MLYIMFNKYIIFTFLCIVTFQLISQAQLKADFTPDKSNGCAPLTIKFTNTTKGASANAIYEWDFNNGNTSLLKDPGAVFLEAKSYTVRLTVRDGNKTSSVTQTCIVYKKPIVDFAASLQKGCVPFPVNFTANASAGDGSISGYLWDFGDGFTGQTSNTIINHTYTAKRIPAISLSVTNSYGCQSTLVKENILSVLEALDVSFSTDKKVLCSINDAAQFINKTTGPGTLTYTWDFGDGQTSTSPEPSHIYNSKGTYPVKLMATSSEGCKDTLLQNEFINVANYKTDWETVGLLCEGNLIQFSNKSVPPPDQSVWEFGNTLQQTTAGNTDVESWYPSAGSYNVKLTNSFGDCKEELIKQIKVNALPDIKGFLVDITGTCGAPVKVNFKDTCSTAVKWNWQADYPTYFQSNLKEPSFDYPMDYDHYMSLTVTNAQGCSATIGKQVIIHKPLVTITSPDILGNGEIHSCGPRPIPFTTTSDLQITSYKWNFGDGATSVDPNPIHTYTKEGDYKVNLSYILSNGCTGVTEFQGYVVVRDKVKADFTVSATDICGNTPITLNSLVTAPYYYHTWDMGDGVLAPNNAYPSNFTYQYQQEGTFTIRLIINNLVCADTMVKTNYIKVSPPFPKITGFTNTCEGTRGTITFTQASKQTSTWHWDFGDGTTLNLNTDQPQVQHIYTKTGWYKVVLTTTNGSCTVGDSVYVTVLLKQKPVLTADKTAVCSTDDYLTLTFSNLEKNPSATGSSYGYGYGPWYHTDGSFAPGHVSTADLGQMPFSHSLWNFTPGKEGLQAVVHSEYFGCSDTTNWFPLKIKGPIPGFKQNITDPCMNGNVVFLEDTSGSVDNVPLKSWEWYFGDGITQTTNIRTVSHTYNWPGIYPVNLKVTDANGCYGYYYGSADAENRNLQASFTTSATTVSPGTRIDFSNTTITSDAGNTIYKWLLGDGTETDSYDAFKTYAQPGQYIVKLITTNTATGCVDTAEVTVTVKYINAAFAIDQSYTSTSQCPPVLVKFTNTSSNINKISWNFGDGTVVNDVYNPSHIYTKPGKFIITLITESDNGSRYTTTDSILIKVPSANITSDILFSCTAQTITLHAVADNASAYFWDFGDGTITQTRDTFSTHRYQSPGIYEPKLIVNDINGCAGFVSLADKIIIDSLFITLDNLPEKICAPKEVLMNPVIVSIAAQQEPQALSFHWDFGTTVPGDTSNIRIPSFIYQQQGNYNVKLIVKSSYGCVKETSHTISAYQGLGVGINGPASVCEETPVQFTGTTQLQGQPAWKWIFDDGTIVNQQNPPPKKYNDPGTYVVKLLVDNNGCTDTISHLLNVNAKPSVTLSVNSPVLCAGSQAILSASGGISYTWSPATGLNSTNGNSVTASPANDISYKVTVTNGDGCVNTDSVHIGVVYPFKLTLTEDVIVCAGKSVQLNASGAATYTWINNTTGLSSVQVANPLVAPFASSVFTVVGIDANHCFSDTASVRVNVQGSPSVDAGPSIELFAGTSYQLKPVASNDVITWNWSPVKYLSCADCPSPETTPLEPVIYEVTVVNAAGVCNLGYDIG
ncbi:MAG: PKD domain-containing protein [Bacteroidota bacterium]